MKNKKTKSTPAVILAGSTIAILLATLESIMPGILYASTARALAMFVEFAGTPLQSLQIEVIPRLLPMFRKWLRDRKFKKNTVKSYCGCVSSLYKRALELGWVPTPSDVEIAWKTVASVLPNPKRFSSLMRYAIANDIPPSQLTGAHLEAFAKLRISEGVSPLTADSANEGLRGSIRRSNSQSLFPKLPVGELQTKFGVAIKDMPEPLRSQLTKLLKWKTDPVVIGRPADYRIRMTTAKNVEEATGRFYGFLTLIMGMAITTMEQFVTRPNTEAFISWMYNERKVKRVSLSVFSGLFTALCQHPDFKAGGYTWFKEIISFIPEEEEAGPRDRKSAKYLRYDELAKIPDKMANFRKKFKFGTKRYAVLVRNELIIRFLLTMCWRQRNIRECRLGPLDKHNIFKQEIDPLQVIKVPEWAAEELSRNSHAEFWQVYFREPETKIGRAVRGVLDRNLIKLLEEYIEFHRPVLLDGADSANLFVAIGGNEIEKGRFSDMVGAITRGYAGRKVTPHIFRDSFAHRYLEENPEDYLSLSKILWHRVLQTTIMKYGRYFDESHGMYKASQWLERRGTSRKPHPEDASQKGSSSLNVIKRAA